METFVNADYIVRGLSGRNTDVVAFEAGRIMLERLHQLGDILRFEKHSLTRPQPEGTMNIKLSLKRPLFYFLIPIVPGALNPLPA